VGGGMVQTARCKPESSSEEGKGSVYILRGGRGAVPAKVCIGREGRVNMFDPVRGRRGGDCNSYEGVEVLLKNSEKVHQFPFEMMTSCNCFSCQKDVGDMVFTRVDLTIPSKKYMRKVSKVYEQMFFPLLEILVNF